ncbi:MAG TPA: S8 family serine peptidase [Saprospiraceae bacterium]|nr:S8 family serine peptidase [Saprospiraceae bacterium]
MDWIYPISYLTSLSGLVMWFITQGNKKLSRNMSALFLTGFFVYLAALAFSSGATPYKLLILVRDMVVLGIVSQLFNVFKKHKLLSLALGLVAVCILFFSYFRTLTLTFPQFPAKEVDPQGEFLVQIDPGNIGMIEKIKTQFDCNIERAFLPQKPEETELDDYYIVDLKSARTRQTRLFYDRYVKSKLISWIEPNEELQLSLPESTEPLRSVRRHYLNDPGIELQWGFEPMEVDKLHQSIAESGLKPVKIARVVVLDTGIEATHEDLQQNYHSVHADSDTDPNGHGTHCAGIIGAVSNNALGIASLSPAQGYVEISSIRVLNAMGGGTQKSILDGMIKAVDSGADVISISLGGISTQSRQKAYQDAVRYAEKHGTIVVVAAGNNGKNARAIAPANVEGVIAVSAIDEENKKATFSNTVEDLKMGIAAPGVNIYSTLPGNKYGNHSGTSMAAPQVSGLIGLMKSMNPELTSEEIYRILKSTGKETKAGKFTGPLIQPLKALEEIID